MTLSKPADEITSICDKYARYFSQAPVDSMALQYIPQHLRCGYSRKQRGSGCVPLAISKPPNVLHVVSMYSPLRKDVPCHPEMGKLPPTSSDNARFAGLVACGRRSSHPSHPPNKYPKHLTASQSSRRTSREGWPRPSHPQM